MRQYLPNVLLFILLAAGLTAGWWYIDRTFFPREPVPPARELALAVAGGVVGETEPARTLRARSRPDVKEPPPAKERGKEKEKEKEPTRPAEPPPITPTQPPELIALGTEGFNKRILLTTRGAGIQQVILTKVPFEEANRLGREVRRPDGKIQPLRLIPGMDRRRAGTSLTDIHDNPAVARMPDLHPGVVPSDLAPLLSEPSYVLMHYPSEDDPLRQPKEALRMNEEFPSPELRDRTWTVVERHQPPDGSEQRVVFETTLGAPYHLRLRKTYTLAPQDYHVGFTLDIIPEPGRVKGKGLFRYQVAGPRGLPVEGEWYTYTYRNALVGWVTNKGGAKRAFEDAGSINTKHGGDEVRKGAGDFGRFTYAAVVTQYFASALAIDDTQSPTVMAGMWDYVRPTREPHPSDPADQPFLSDITVRVVSGLLDPAPGEPVTHKYLIYNGPVKVRLLKMMPPGSEVDEGLADRYLDQLTLKTMSDYHSPNFFGRVANFIWWADVVITFTNLMHSVLYGIHKYTGLPWGICIVLLTVCVRLALMLPSRKQQAMMIRMQEKMSRIKPEIDKLTEKYKDNPQLLQQEKARLMFKHGINPVSTMSGCLLLFAQMPIFMGLYFCLQESVFFRLEPLIPGLYAWAPNLSAPDMLVWWSENIPWISTPENLGGAIYLGPFLNILPLLATGLIFLQQKISMPPPTDEMQEQQQKMMKFMILFMAVFFYKVPAGLCVYFICSTTWALIERKLIPKPKANLPDAAAGPGDDSKPATANQSEAPANGATGGGFLSRLKARVENMQAQADEQARRQIRREPPPPGGGRGKKKRKK